MSAVKELAGHLVEFGGEIHTHEGWLARRADGTSVAGYRYARLERCAWHGDRTSTCGACVWHYVGRSFASEDAVTVLAEIVGAS